VGALGASSVTEPIGISPSSAVDFTVAVCTWNRCEILARTLGALCLMNRPSGASFEVLVVNNNSTDATSSVVDRFAGRLPIREVFEPTPGLSAARNCSIQSAMGRYICWIDDDIRVDGDWLGAYANAVSGDPGLVMLGGPIEPDFDGDAPDWILGSLPVIGGVYGMTPAREGETLLDVTQLPFGGNMVVRTDVARRYPFDRRLGRTAGNMMAGEEAFVLRQILEDGHKGRWVSGAKVWHFIPKRMQKIEHVRRYFHDWGVSLALMQPADHAAGILGRPAWMWRQAIQAEMSYRMTRLWSRPTVWTAHLKAASMAWGGLRRRPAAIPRARP